ncbi:hypothetical protein TNCV_1818111 [Trichonephila clavipes]|nr:hypothetical protein TNCV_1818111 [Trichonephila clavipes]
MLPVLGKKAVLEWCMEEGSIGSSYVCPKMWKKYGKERTVRCPEERCFLLQRQASSRKAGIQLVKRIGVIFTTRLPIEIMMICREHPSQTGTLKILNMQHNHTAWTILWNFCIMKIHQLGPGSKPQTYANEPSAEPTATPNRLAL